MIKGESLSMTKIFKTAFQPMQMSFKEFHGQPLRSTWKIQRKKRVWNNKLHGSCCHLSSNTAWMKHTYTYQTKLTYLAHFSDDIFICNDTQPHYTIYSVHFIKLQTAVVKWSVSNDCAVYSILSPLNRFPPLSFLFKADRCKAKVFDGFPVCTQVDWSQFSMCQCDWHHQLPVADWALQA